jgi:hypothetical protein
MTLREFGVLFVKTIAELHDFFSEGIGELVAMNTQHELRGIVGVVRHEVPPIHLVDEHASVNLANIL